MPNPGAKIQEARLLGDGDTFIAYSGTGEYLPKVPILITVRGEHKGRDGVRQHQMHHVGREVYHLYHRTP